MIRPVVLLVIALLACASLTAGVPGTLRGRVEIRHAPPDRVRRPNPADLGMPIPPQPPDRRSVVYLDPAPQAAFEPRDAPRARIDQHDETFVPHVLAIVAGTTVDFPNSDITYHNVFSLSRAKTFDLGRYARGKSKSIRFDSPGIVRVFCEIHSHMSAFVLVFAHRYFAVTDPDGDYRIDNVPPGNYNVFVWNEALALESRRVAVPETGGDIEVNFAFGRK
jgi:plastocyanin